MNKDQILYYSQRAQEYEKIYDKPERQNDIYKITQYLKTTFNKNDVFEIACGTGYWTQYISKTANSIFATDINKSVIKIAKSKKYSCPVKFHETDIFNLSSINQTFNSGFAGFIWSHIAKQDLQSFVTHFLSKINKDGIVVFIDNLFVKNSSTPVESVDEYGNTYQKRRLENGSYHKVIKNFPTDSEIINLINPFGTNIDIKRLDYFWILQFNKK